MVQHGINIVLSILVILLSFVAAISGSITEGFQWLFIALGIGVFVIASWGMAEFVLEHHRMPSDL